MTENLNNVSSADAALKVVASTLLAFALPVIDELDADPFKPLLILVTKSDFEVSSDHLRSRPTPVMFGGLVVPSTVRSKAVPFTALPSVAAALIVFSSTFIT